MITHSIEKYTVVKPAAPNWVLSKNKAMGKLEFAQFLGALNVKKGDLVCYKTSCPPYSKHQVNKVVDIDEVHLFVKDWGNEHSGPMIYTLAGWGMKSTWKGDTSSWFKVPDALVPSEWRNAPP